MASPPIFGQESVFPKTDINISPFILAKQSNKIKKGKSLQLRKSNESGEWKKFTNWNEAIAVVAENDSIVWVGTSAGLVRWNANSKTFQTYDKSNGLKFTSITSLALDTNNTLWIGTIQGLVEFVHGSFIYFNQSNDPILKGGVHKVIVDPNNKIYACTNEYTDFISYTNGGVVIYDGTTWQNISIPSVSGGTGAIDGIIWYRDTLFLGIGAFKTYIYTQNGLEPAPGWPNEEAATSFVIDYQDSLWAMTYQGRLLKYSSGTWRTMATGFSVTRIWNDPKGGLWISNPEAWYVSGYSPSRLDFEELKNNEYCSSSIPGLCQVSALSNQFIDQYALNASNQFFATKWGLVKYTGTTWRYILSPATLLSNTVNSLGSSPLGDIYFGGELATQKTNGIDWNSIGDAGWYNPQIKFNPDGLYSHTGIGGEFVTGLDYDGYDALWTAYGSIKTQNQNGITEWLPQDISAHWTPPNNYPQFMDITVDRDENVWATGWYRAAAMYDRTQWHPFYSNDTLLPNGSYDRIFADSKGRVWFTTNQQIPNYGFTIFNKGRLENYYFPDNFWGSFIYQLAEDHFGNIWLATWGGLIKYDGTTYTVIDTSNSRLESNNVNAVTVDNRNNIWIGTRGGGLYVYNQSGIQLGPYSNSTPVDTFSMKQDGIYVDAMIFPKSVSGISAKLELQRGRSVHKFWTISATDFLPLSDSKITLKDTTAIIGKYYYRIKQIESSGNTSYSPAIQFSGGHPQIKLIDAQLDFIGYHLTFRWKTDNENYLSRFEIVKYDSLLKQYYSIASLPANSQKDKSGYFVLVMDSLAQLAIEYTYSLVAVFSDSTRDMLKTFLLTPQGILDKFTVSNNYPNPFNGYTAINIFFPKPDKVSITIFDITGRRIRAPLINNYDQGYHRIQLDFRNVSSGIYFYRVESSENKTVGKMILIK